MLLSSVEFEGAEFVVTSGDYDKLLEKVKHILHVEFLYKTAIKNNIIYYTQYIPNLFQILII